MFICFPLHRSLAVCSCASAPRHLPRASPVIECVQASDLTARCSGLAEDGLSHLDAFWRRTGKWRCRIWCWTKATASASLLPFPSILLFASLLITVRVPLACFDGCSPDSLFIIIRRPRFFRVLSHRREIDRLQRKMLAEFEKVVLPVASPYCSAHCSLSLLPGCFGCAG